MKSGQVNIDKTKPVVDDDGHVQLRLTAIMYHPDYSIDAAFGGRSPRYPNRNTELDQMPMVDLIYDVRNRIIEVVQADPSDRRADDFAYCQFMSDVWYRGIQQGLVHDSLFRLESYLQEGKYVFRGVPADAQLMYPPHKNLLPDSLE